MDNTEEKADSENKTAEGWLNAIRQAGKDQKTWEARGDKVVKRYRDERPSENNTKKFNILWSNISTLKPAVFARVPKPVVTRRFRDADPLSREASKVIERALEYSLDSYDFESAMKSPVEDYLLPGRGINRVLYKPTYGEPVPETNDEGMPLLDDKGELKTYRPVVYEEVESKYQFWKDFRHGKARVWSEVPWVAYREYMDRKELQDRFPEHIDIPLNYKSDDDSDAESDKNCKKAIIWEIWDKQNFKTIWVAEDYDQILEEGEPPLDFHGFFPSPKPLYSLVTNGNLIPVPDYCQYQDQADELDELSARINALLTALRVCGFYAADEKDSIAGLFNGNTDNQMIPVDSWQMWADKGGVKGLIDWYPVDQVANVLIGLYDAREKTKQELYEITGLSDIIRGSSNPNETATAQRIKGQFASLRVEDRQKDVQKYIRDIIRLKAEVICEHFSMETLQAMTGLQYPTKVWQQIMDLLRNDPIRSFKIDIETDSTIQVDDQAEKQNRVEFLEAMTGFIGQVAQVGQQAPQMMPLFGQMMMFAVRGFRAGRDLEDAFEQTIAEMEQAAAQPQQPQVDPEKEAKAAKIQNDMQRDNAKFQHDVAIENKEFELDKSKVMHGMQIDEMKASQPTGNN